MPVIMREITSVPFTGQLVNKASKLEIERSPAHGPVTSTTPRQHQEKKNTPEL
jgi:hypothetical protein